LDLEVVREYLTDAIRYWEPRRAIYNAVLGIIVLTYFWIYHSRGRANVSADSVQVLFLLAVIANVAYCSAYLVDLVWQASAFRERWKKRRWILLLIGIIAAGILTRFWAIALLAECCG